MKNKRLTSAPCATSQPALPESLTTQEQQLLRGCEETIDAGFEIFVVVGRALMTIRDQRLYRADYETFKEYCRARWDLSRSHAYRFIAETIVVDQLSPAAVLPNERQARELVKLPEEMRRKVWQDAISFAEGSRVTIRHVLTAIHGTPSTAKPRDFGEPISFRGLTHAPINEQGVVFLFGMVSKDLEFWVESVQNPYPDCIAKRKVRKGRRQVWNEVRIEFEFQSRNFRSHGHSHECDLIVCWEHNWPDCPIEVIELKTEIQKLDPRVSEH